VGVSLVREALVVVELPLVVEVVPLVVELEESDVLFVDAVGVGVEVLPLADVVGVAVL